MTSAQLLHPDGWTNRAITGILTVLVFSALLTGCHTAHAPHAPALHSSSAVGQLWAVAPPANESGVTVIDVFRVADLLAQETERIDGIHVVPVNRVIAAMRYLELDRIATPEEAMALVQTLGVDGLIVGTITAYDPYPPPTLGMAIELHRAPRGTVPLEVDPAHMTRATAGEPSLGAISAANPTAYAAGVFDASHQRVQSWAESYARTRVDPDSAYGTDIYLVSMELYTKFVSYRLLRDLIRHEQGRMQQVAAHQDTR